MKNTKVALFLPSLKGGGAERVMVNLANEFTKNGLDVDLVLADAQGEYLSIVSEKVNIINLSKSRVLFSLISLIKYLKSEKPAVLLSTMAHANIIAVLATWLAGWNNRVFVRETNTVSVTLAQTSLMNRVVWRVLIHLFYKKATAIIAPSQGVACDLEEVAFLPKDSVNVIYNPIVTPELKNLADKPLLHRWLYQSEFSVILAVGRLNKQKDFPTLIKALKITREKQDVRLIILGEGELRVSLMQLITDLDLSDYVEMPGFKSNPFNFMRNADLFVLSSAWEGLPGTLIQAMASGCQVVSTNCPSGPSEILENGKYGSLTPVGDANALSCAIIDALNSDSKPDVVERSSFFDVEKSVKTYLALMKL